MFIQYSICVLVQSPVLCNPDSGISTSSGPEFVLVECGVQSLGSLLVPELVITESGDWDVYKCAQMYLSAINPGICSPVLQNAGSRDCVMYMYTRLAILLLEELTKACMLLVVFLYLKCSDEVPARLGDDRVLYPSSYM